MSEWKKVKLGEVATIFSGFAFKSKDMNKISGIPLIKIKNINNFAVSKECDSYLNTNVDLAKLERFKLQQIDFLIAMTGQGSVGRVGKMMDYSPAYYVNQRVAIVRPIVEKVNSFFLYKCLATNDREKELFNKANGAGQPNISPAQIGDLDLLVPSLVTQNRIATILSRYDSLIENYQKQIKLLEEAAQRLYKEWFVELRFPGHENTKIVDGVPEGWKKGVLNDIAYESGKKVDKKNRDYYNYYLPIDCLPKHSLTYLTPADISLAESSLVSFEENDIIFGAMRPYFHKVCFAQSNGLTRTTCFVLNSKENEYREYLLMLLFEDSTVKHATSISVGTTMPYTRWKEFKSMEIIIPAKEIAVVFGKQISRITNVLNKLSSQIRLLTEARDRLLPKLMSGEIAV